MEHRAGGWGKTCLNWMKTMLRKAEPGNYTRGEARDYKYGSRNKMVDTTLIGNHTKQHGVPSCQLNGTKQA